jgi:uncharacterized LabA/DUF88 family protein
MILLLWSGRGPPAIAAKLPRLPCIPGQGSLTSRPSAGSKIARPEDVALFLFGDTMENRRGKVALFIDGANLHIMAKALGFDVDFKRLLDEFGAGATLLRAYYYITVMEDLEYCPVRPLVDWLDYNGYTVVTKAVREFVDDAGRRRVKANMDVELAVDAMDLAAHVDEIVLFSGDGNFRSLITSLQRRGIRVTIVSTLVSDPPMVSDELRRRADDFIELADLKEKLGRRTFAARPVKQAYPAMPVERRRSTVGLATPATRLPDSVPEGE